MENNEIDAIERLYRLRDLGVLNEEEYQKQKLKVLDGTLSRKTYNFYLLQSIICFFGTLSLLTILLSITPDWPDNIDAAKWGASISNETKREAFFYYTIFSLWIIPHSFFILYKTSGMKKRNSINIIVLITLSILAILILSPFQLPHKT